jgi:hypothetical protein
MRAAGSLDQLRGDADTITHPAHTALQQVGDAELAADFIGTDGPAAKGERGVAGHYDKLAKASQARDDLLGDPVTEVSFLGLAAHVFKRQNRDGGLARQRG